MLTEFVAAACVLFAPASFAGWVITGLRLKGARREREALANSSQVIDLEKQVLALVARGASLDELLDAVTRAIEGMEPECVCTILLLDEEERTHLLKGSGGSTPAEYMKAISGLEIGPEVGACGSAAFRNETVVVEDIATDYRFAAAKDFVMSFGLRSCWSVPIRNYKNVVLGTFAMYHRTPAKPRSGQLRLVEAGAYIAGNVIERLRSERRLRDAADRLDLAEKAASFGIWEVDIPAAMVTVSDGFAALVGLIAAKRRISLSQWSEMIHPADRDALQIATDRAGETGDLLAEFRIVRPDGSIRWERSQGHVQFTDGQAILATGAMIDITQEKNLLIRLQQANTAAETSATTAREAERLEQDRKRILELVAKDQPLEAILTALAHTVASHLPDCSCSIQIELRGNSRISVSTLTEERLEQEFHQIPIGGFIETLSELPVIGVCGDPEWRRRSEDSPEFYGWNYLAVRVLQGTVAAGVIIALLPQDRVTSPAERRLLESWGQFAGLAVERRRLYEQLSFRAQNDSLTLLLNRASLYDRMDEQLSNHASMPLSVLYFDLDFFKEINDLYGHATGDAVLRNVSSRILESIRPVDIAARVGGDEFVVILPKVADRKEARRIGELIVRAVSQPIVFDEREFRVGSSFGVAVYPADGQQADALFNVADKDMYMAKLSRECRAERARHRVAIPASAPVRDLSAITALADAFRRVSVERNYAIRATKVRDDEFGVLIDSFNEMLSQIETDDRDRRIAEDALRRSEERYALAAHGANDGLWDWKLGTNEIYLSPRWTRMLGYSDNEIWCDPDEWFGRIHPADRERVQAQLSSHRQGSTSEFSSEYRIRHKNGLYIWVLSRGIAVRDEKGTAVRIAGSQTDITEGKVADPLTQLPNRIYLTDKLESAIAKGNPGVKSFAVLLLDLDRFKIVNDSLGHAAGNQLLTEVAQRLRSIVRDHALSARLAGCTFAVARLGGEEFAILVEAIRDQDDAVIVAESILKHLGAAFHIDGRQVFESGSIGIAMSCCGDTPDDLLRNADTAMYYAKARGGGRFEVFNQGMRERAVARMEIEKDLKKAIEDNELVLHYQPKVSLIDQRITGFEALVRWNNPKRGMLYPSEFISVAEETGLIIPLGRWVLLEGCRQMAAWHKSVVVEPKLTISINISFRQLAGTGLVEDVERILAETGLDPKTLKLEMTESSIMENAQIAIATLRRFKELSIGLEIDDFGTGYSSLSYLRQLPFDTVKIDHSFVKELGTAEDTSEIIGTILQLARSLGMDVVAEGVETKDQLARLTEMGCSSGQGYYFSRPVDAERALRLIRDKDALQRGILLGKELCV
jgi:diguanylate cyclase (GGDEF)-like protein/PAS domain S-box-containing protein